MLRASESYRDFSLGFGGKHCGQAEISHLRQAVSPYPHLTLHSPMLPVIGAFVDQLLFGGRGNVNHSVVKQGARSNWVAFPFFA